MNTVMVRVKLFPATKSHCMYDEGEPLIQLKFDTKRDCIILKGNQTETFEIKSVYIIILD